MLLKFLLIVFSLPLFASDPNIVGFWKTYNEKTKKPQIVVGIYSHEGKYYGRIVGIYDQDGNIGETLTNAKDRAPGVVGNPFYCGLDFIYNLKTSGTVFKGKIVDPKKGNVYNAEIWREKEKLIVRGKLLIFGRNQTWFAFDEGEFNANFPKPDLSSFSPVIPKVN